jgi:ATP-binding cassette subfamily C protein
VGAARQIGFRAPRRTHSAVPYTVEGICGASRVRHRAVTLRDAWWRADHGPLLAFRGGDPVALLPAGTARYLLLDPADGTRVPVTGAVAATLDARAFVFYAPLPRRPLGAGDLLRAALRSSRRELRTVAAVGCLAGLLGLAAPLATARLVGSALPRGDRGEVLALAAALVGSALAAGLFHLARAFAVLRVEAKLDQAVQGGVWDHLLSLPVSFFRRYSVGDLHARAMGIEAIRGVLSGHVLSAVLSFVFSLFSFGLLFYYSPSLAGVATLLVAALAGVTLAVARAQIREQRQLHHQRGRVSSLLFDLLGGILKLRVAGAEARARGEWARAYAAQRQAEMRSQRLANLQAVVNTTYAMLAPLVLFAALGALGGDLTVGEFLAFNVAFGQFQAAVFGVLSVATQVFATVPVYERMKPILEAAPEVGDERPEVGELAGELELRGVSFRYAADGPPVLDDVSIRVGAGEFVALVGPSGSGKSTCLRLLLGFEQPASGTVLVDGHELSRVDAHSVRRQVGVVLQDGQPLVGTIFANIIGSRNLGLEDAWWAARMMCLENEIRELPMGMYTFINDKGTNFSGGQRQRMLIARAIVSRPRVILLDEATSALDNRTQEVVVRNLEQLNATRLVIAHRLSTIVNADRIYVLDGGRVAESGTFDELMARDGAFARMVERQRA